MIVGLNVEIFRQKKAPNLTGGIFPWLKPTIFVGFLGGSASIDITCIFTYTYLSIYLYIYR